MNKNLIAANKTALVNLMNCAVNSDSLAAYFRKHRREIEVETDKDFMLLAGAINVGSINSRVTAIDVCENGYIEVEVNIYDNIVAYLDNEADVKDWKIEAVYREFTSQLRRLYGRIFKQRGFGKPRISIVLIPMNWGSMLAYKYRLDDFTGDDGDEYGYPFGRETNMVDIGLYDYIFKDSIGFDDGGAYYD